MEILDILIRRVCAANEIDVSSRLIYIYALAFQGERNQEKELGFIEVEVSELFDITHIPAESSYEEYFNATLLPASNWEDRILRLFEN